MPALDENTRSGSEPAFRSTGPQGHRGRMRDRLLDRGAAALADYEILEMLLFLGIPYRDTKPTAKSAINGFGSLAAVLSAKREALRATPGLTPACAEAIVLVRHAAARLAAAEPTPAPVLRDPASLRAYVMGVAAAPLRVFHLDNRNRLLADEAADTAEVKPGVILRRALELHAVSLLLACWRENPYASRADRDALRGLREAAAPLAVGVHDLVLVAEGDIISVGGVM